MSSLEEAQLLTRYLIKKDATAETAKLYAQAMRKAVKISDQDQKLQSFISKHHWSLGFIDAGLALRQPHSEIRRRLYTMLAILEASPEYYDDFLPKRRNPLYLIFVGFTGLRAVIKAMCGILLIGLAT